MFRQIKFLKKEVDSFRRSLLYRLSTNIYLTMVSTVKITYHFTIYNPYRHTSSTELSQSLIQTPTQLNSSPEH